MLEGIGRFEHARYGFCIVTLCKGKQDNREFYAFVAIEPQNYPYFQKNYKSGQAADFHAFGQELLRGWGASPPPDILDFVHEKYGIEFDVDQNFVERLVALTHSSPFPLKPAKASGF